MPWYANATLVCSVKNVNRGGDAQSRDLWLVAIHEASHLVLLRKFGGVGNATLWRNAQGGLEERHWLGRVQILGAPGDVQFERGLKTQNGRIKTPLRWAAYVGLAGFIGDLIARREFDPADIYDSFQFAVDDDAISEADLSLIDGHFTERALLKTADYVYRWWAEIEREAIWLYSAAES